MTKHVESKLEKQTCCLPTDGSVVFAVFHVSLRLPCFRERFIGEHLGKTHDLFQP